MLGLITVLLIAFLALSALLFVFTTWFQAYIYSQPAAKLYYFAPAAAAGVIAFLAIWCVLEYRNPQRFETIFNVGFSDDKQFKELIVPAGEEKVLYKSGKDARGKTVYLSEKDRRPLPTHVDALIVKEGDREVVFKAERDAKGKFKIAQGSGSLRYLDDHGRAMLSDNPGVLTTQRWGWLVLDAIVNLLHLIVWWMVLWLLLRFQWSHALGLAVIFWLVVTLTMMPMLLARVRTLTPKKPAPTATAALRMMQANV